MENEENFVLDDEARLLITTTASLAAIAFDKAQLFEMTKDELQSEKKFSAKQFAGKKTFKKIHFRDIHHLQLLKKCLKILICLN